VHRSLRALAVNRDALTALRRIVRAIDTHSRRLVLRHGITGPQALLLKKLLEKRAEAVTVGELARRVNLGQATVTDILDRLEQRGLVTRTRSDADRRRVLVRPTAAADKVLRAAAPLLEDSFAAEFDRLAPQHRAQIVDSLNRVAAMLGAPALDGGLLLADAPLAVAGTGLPRASRTAKRGRHTT
jgi:DNA-binding MarR family transcriptional regulator